MLENNQEQDFFKLVHEPKNTDTKMYIEIFFISVNPPNPLKLRIC